jgi:hypothetical protein
VNDILRPYVAIAIFSLGLSVGFFSAWLLASPPDAPLTQAQRDYNDANVSRARYLNAKGSLDRAWGGWNVLVLRNYRDYTLIVGIDTRATCEAAARELDAQSRAQAACFESMEAKENSKP